jgi:hypothetical protein
MAKVKTEKLNFSKFFPQSTSFVSISGWATGSDNFNVDVKIGDGDKSVSLYTSDWFKNDGLETLKAIQEGVTKAIEFQQKALKLPKAENVWDDFFTDPSVKKDSPKRVLKSTETAVKKKK